MSEWFPERQITSEEAELMMFLCGGSPPDPETSNHFLQRSRYTAFPDEATLFRGMFSTFGENYAEILDMPSEKSGEVFTKSALFYAGVFQQLFPHTEGVPFEVSVFQEFTDTDSRRTSWTLPKRIQEEIPSYCDLLEQAAPVLGIETEKQHDLALIGSGVVHAVAVGSLRFKRLFDRLELEEDFKDLDL